MVDEPRDVPHPRGVHDGPYRRVQREHVRRGARELTRGRHPALALGRFHDFRLFQLLAKVSLRVGDDLADVLERHALGR